MNAANKLVSFNEFKYEKYYRNVNEGVAKLNKVFINKRKEQLKKDMIKGYMLLLSNFNNWNIHI